MLKKRGNSITEPAVDSSPPNTNISSPLLNNSIRPNMYGAAAMERKASASDGDPDDDNRYPAPFARTASLAIRARSSLSGFEASASGSTPYTLKSAYQNLPPEYGGSSMSINVGVTSRENARSKSRLRAMTHGDLTSYWPGAMEVRRLFRLFDTNGDGLISSQELRSGLELLGFDVSHLSAVHNLQAELSDDRTGIIGEQQFIRAFRSLNRATLTKKLASNEKYSNDDSLRACTLTVIDMGSHDGQDQFVRRRADMRSMSEMLDEPPAWDHHIRWLDVCGLHDVALQLLGSHLNLPKQVLEDVQLEQTSTYEVYEQTKMLKIVIHALHIHNFPCTVDSQGVSQLVSPRQYKQNRPSLEAVAIHIVIVDEHTVLTVRPNSSHATFNSIWEEIIGIMDTGFTRTKSRASSIPSSPKSSSTSPSTIPDVSRVVSIFHHYTPTSLAMDLVTEVAERNWILRDMFKDWKITLGEKIRENSESYLLTHILDLDGIALLSVKILKPMSRMFYEIIIAMGGGQISSPCHHQQQIAATFLSSAKDEIRSAAQSIQRLYEQAIFTTQMTKTLREFYSQRSDEQMNRTLYLLTVVTTVVTPLQLSASVYGMNFENLPELHFDYAYYYFWIINIALIVIISLWFKKQRYF